MIEHSSLDDLYSNLSGDNGEACYMRYFGKLPADQKAKLETCIVIKETDDFVLSLIKKIPVEYLAKLGDDYLIDPDQDFNILDFRSTIIQSGKVLISYTIFELAGKLYDISYNIYDNQEQNPFVAFDLARQSELRLFIVTEKGGLPLRYPNYLKPIMSRLLDQHINFEPWSQRQYNLAMYSFYASYKTLRDIYNRLDLSDPNNRNPILLSDPILRMKRVDTPNPDDINNISRN